jgi:hypothetical protein
MLLVRSPRSPDDGAGENVDLIFVGVDYVALPAHLAGVRVTIGSPDSLRQVASRMARAVSQDTGLYELESSGTLHHVVAASLMVAWTTCGPMESSLVLHFDPDEQTERRFRQLHLRKHAVVDWR